MPKRTMTVSRLWYHPFRKTDEAGQVADLPDGSDMFDMFTEFVERDIDRERLVRPETETYIALGESVLEGRCLLPNCSALFAPEFSSVQPALKWPS